MKAIHLPIFLLSAKVALLSSLLASLILIAFLFHTILDIVGGKYGVLRDLLPSRKEFFYYFRALIRIYVLKVCKNCSISCSLPWKGIMLLAEKAGCLQCDPK